MLHFKNCDRNRIKKFIVLRLEKFEQGFTVVKIKKKKTKSAK
jgi:hypothetical protein